MKNKKNTINTYFYRNKLLVSLLVLFSILGGISDTLWAFAFQNTSRITKGATTSALIHLGLFVLFCFVYFQVVENTLAYIRRKLLRKMNLQLKTDVFNAIMQKDMNEFTESNSAAYISILNNDVLNIENQYFVMVPGILQNTFIFLGCTGVLIYYNATIAVIALVTALIPVSLPFFFGDKISEKEKAVYEELENYNGRLKDLLGGFEVIKSFNATDKVKSIFTRSAKKVEDARYSSRKYQNPYVILMLTITYLVIVLQLLFSAYMVSIGKVDQSAMLSIFFLISSINNPIQEIAEKCISIKSAAPNVKKVEKLLNDKHGEKQSSLESVQSLVPLKLNELTYRYEAGVDVLKKVNFIFEGNKKYAIVGNSGSGKSTLVKLMMKYYDDYQGEIYWGDQELKTIDKESLYSKIAIIQQNVFLFEDTLKNNITMFQSYPEEDIWYAVKAAGLEALVQKSPEGLEMRVSENGNNFSGGEQQRISIARAILKKTKVLILDEATSSLDKRLSAQIENLILDQPDMTVITVTHKLDQEILRRYDCILAVNQGDIIESDTFDELISRKGFFYSLYTVSA